MKDSCKSGLILGTEFTTSLALTPCGKLKQFYFNLNNLIYSRDYG